MCPRSGPKIGARSSRRARYRHDHGSTLLVFAIACPVLALLTIGIIDVGLNYSNKAQLENATRSAARAASVADAGTMTSCPLRGVSTATDATKALLCSAKRGSHIDPDLVAVKVLYTDTRGSETTDPKDNVANSYSIVVCMSAEIYSITGLFGPVLDGHFQHSRQVITASTPRGGAFIPPAEETPLVSGGVTDNWSWCTADGATG